MCVETHIVLMPCVIPKFDLSLVTAADEFQIFEFLKKKNPFEKKAF